MIAGFDDIPEAAWLAYDLTTFVQDAPLMVDEALRIVSSSTASHASPGEIRIVVPARLVERGSTRR
jgi:DNA-binding LacI/PurR family transcriptional regulator